MKTILPKLALLAVLLPLISCSKDPDAIRTAAITESVARLANCSQTNGTENLANLAFVSVANATNETSLKLVIYATNSAIEFPLPAYKLSAGRWLIGEKDRAYLIDEHCQEFKLKDRRPPQGKNFPQDGIVRLNPGESFEMTLSFYRLKDTTRFGMLVYAGKTLPFVVFQPNS
ncbi:MAG: hypothetical protein JST85_18785 [Acidobacteria bacterium]|nr:hypothetical protein [Acidobacteriota bacterium]